METFKAGDVILDRYEVTAVLGKGGTGVVLAARDRKLGEIFALKFLRQPLREQPEIAARFAEEARTAIRIKSEHVARVYNVETVEGVPFIVMEYLTGRDLAAMIRARVQVSIDESADLLLQACEAIHEAHTLGIVHCDLKPGNLFLTTDSYEMPLVKVLDFGISRSAAAPDLASTTTAASEASAPPVLVGSPQYMSPEQLTSPRSVDARSDVWALGVILYEMVTGVAPFQGDDLAAVSAAISRGEYRRPADLRPDLPPALENTIADALVIQRARRLPSVAAFAKRLAPFATGAGRASYNRIRRRAARAGARPEGALPAEPVAPPQASLRAPAGSGSPPSPAERPGAADSNAGARELSAATATVGGQTTMAHGTLTTDRSVAEPELRAATWASAVLVAALAAAAGLAIALPRMPHPPAVRASAAGPVSASPVQAVQPTQADASPPAAARPAPAQQRSPAR